MSHLIIAKGERQGDEFAIGAAGMRVGRAQSNDLVIDSGTLSQFHCRFFFKSDGSLWVTDFGSTNQTLVNGQPVSEQRLERGDLVDVGGVVFKVIDDRGAAAESDAEQPAAPRADKPPPEPSPAPGQPHYDLGFKRESAPRGKSLVLRLAWAVATLLLIVALALLAVNFTSTEDGAPRAASAAVDLPLEIAYEKVEADNSNIFRYSLRLKDELLSIRIDDIKNTRHIVREKEVEPGLVADLRDRIDDSNFFYLQPDYAGISPGIYELWDMTVTIGAKTSHTRVFNRLEPADFKEVREMVEDFGKTELGLAALALSPEKLREMASDAYLQGRKLFEEREVRYENLYESIRQFKLAQWYLETIEPKPDFYAQAVTGLEDSERALNERYQDYLFRADRAVKLGDWQVAADNLKIILRLVPDRNDERHEDAQKQLLSVERRLR